MIDKLQGPETTISERFTAIAAILHAAMLINYPKMKIKEVKELIDLGNVKSVMEAVIGPPGFLQGKAIVGNFELPSC